MRGLSLAGASRARPEIGPVPWEGGGVSRAVGVACKEK